MQDEATIIATREAAAINHLADEIGEWAKGKGFRKDWTDAEYLRDVAMTIDSGENFNGGVGDVVRRIADEHERLANVCKLMLMVSELAEALEGMREGGNYGEELADLMIRAMENAQANRIPIGDEIVSKVLKNQDRPYMHGKQF